MAIKVTGIFENPQSNLAYKSPLLELVPHMLPYGKIAIDVNIIVDDKQVGAIGMPVERQALTYDTKIEDGHDRLFAALQTHVLNELKVLAPECNYEIVSSKSNEDKAE